MLSSRRRRRAGDDGGVDEVGAGGEGDAQAVPRVQGPCSATSVVVFEVEEEEEEEEEGKGFLKPSPHCSDLVLALFALGNLDIFPFRCLGVA